MIGGTAHNLPNRGQNWSERGIPPHVVVTLLDQIALCMNEGRFTLLLDSTSAMSNWGQNVLTFCQMGSGGTA